MNQQYDYGNCRFCGAKMIMSQRTGKPYCSAKCWDKGGTKFVKQGGELKVREDPDVAIRRNMEIKAQGLAKGAAFNKACDIAIAMYSRGDITSDVIIQKIAEIHPRLEEINKDGTKPEEK